MLYGLQIGQHRNTTEQRSPTFWMLPKLKKADITAGGMLALSVGCGEPFVDLGFAVSESGAGATSKLPTYRHGTCANYVGAFVMHDLKLASTK
jgi:hypothetical protein